MSTSIVWFKTDLRIHDNETLCKAVEKGLPIIPVYCFNEDDFKKTNFGFNKTGNYRLKFLFESLESLQMQLQKLGSSLLILKGKPEDELFKIASTFKSKFVFAKKEVAEEELLLQQRVEKKLWRLNVELLVFSTSTLYHALDLPFSIKDIPDTFTLFRKKVEKECSVRNIFDAPKTILSPALPPFKLPSFTELNVSEPKIHPQSSVFFKGGEVEGLNRMNYYFNESKLVLSYKETRNNLIGANYSSKFSLWLANGCLSPREIYFNLKKFENEFGSNESTYWLVFELLWRDFFRFMFKKHHHKFFLQYGIQTPSSNPLNTHNQEKLMQWINGETESDFVNANMLELKLTGYMSNRGRQNVASYLCNDLKLDWRYGAAYFEQQLIDYDVCSNWGNWAYVAGVGNDPRKDRYFNVTKQANDYDKDGLYRKLWLG